MKEKIKNSFIQIPISLVIIVEVLTIVVGGYFSVRQYQIRQIRKEALAEFFSSSHVLQQTSTTQENNATGTSSLPPKSTSDQMPEDAINETWKKSPKIVSISDNLGNIFEMVCDRITGCLNCYPINKGSFVVSAKSISEIKITVNAQDPNNRPVSFRFYSDDCNKNWTSDNFCSYFTKTNDLGEVSFSVMIKNDDDYNNGPDDCDAYSMLNYEVVE